MGDTLQPSPALLWLGSGLLIAAGALIALRRLSCWVRWGLLLTGAQALWISHLARPDLGIDGGLSLTLAILPLGEMAAINAADVHPPAYYALLHGWVQLAGLSPLATRYTTVLCGIGAIATIGAAGRRLGGPTAGQVAGLVVALTPGVALLATTVRDFTPGLLLAGLAVEGWLRLWCRARDGPHPNPLPEGEGTSGWLQSAFPAGEGVSGGRKGVLSQGEGVSGWGKRVLPESEGREGSEGWLRGAAGRWGGLGLIFGVGLWTTYLFGVVIAALGAASLLSGRRLVRAWAIATLIGGALWLPWLAFEIPYFLGRAASGQTARTPGVTPEDPGYFLSEVALALAGTSKGPLPAGLDWLLLGTLCLVTLVAGWRAVHRAPQDPRPLALGAVAGPLALAGCYLLMRTWANITAVERYAIFATPFFAPAVGYALSRPGRATRVLGWTLAGLVGISALGWSRHLITERYQPGPGWHPVATVEALDELTRSGDAVVFVTLEQPSYYQALSRQPVDWYVVPVLPSYVAGDIGANAARVLSPLLAGHPRIWLVAYLHGLPGTDLVLDWLRDRAYPAGEVRTPDSTITGFLAPGSALGSVPPERPIEAAFEDGLDLRAAAFPESLPAGADLPVELTWQTREQPSADYTVFVHLVTPDQARRIAGHDGLPLAGRGATSRWSPSEAIQDRHGLLIPPDTPPGDYLVVAGLYQDGNRLKLLNGQTQVVLGPVRLGSV